MGVATAPGVIKFTTEGIKANGDKNGCTFYFRDCLEASLLGLYSQLAVRYPCGDGSYMRVDMQTYDAEKLRNPIRRLNSTGNRHIARCKKCKENNKD